MKVGERVGAISHVTKTTAYLFGYGRYDGDVTPSEELGVQFFGNPMRIPNPQITLDNGKKVYGCECWWGPEEVVKKRLAEKVVVEVDIEEARREAA